MNMLKNSTEKTLDLSLSSTEIESFDSSISLSDSFEQTTTSFLKSKASVLDEILLIEEDFNSTILSYAPKLNFKQSTIITEIPNFALD